MKLKIAITPFQQRLVTIEGNLIYKVQLGGCIYMYKIKNKTLSLSLNKLIIYIR